ncbi:disease resistance protein RPV1-like [Telopea speciosissima]|uniref:disease resistance protein RPV1-like n=1 Tax=Telopea speciosissima TaxID=54955 RepID=UPI001CC410DE|nr:disease resistance protein RPV1-like [Telopea speciosissima]
MAARSASSSGWSYEVFLNFRGIDARTTFTEDLYNALVAAGIHTFIDDVKLRTGEEIGPELLSEIQKSRISIPIFSKNYASSKWCLNELVKIVECRKTMNQLVMPIFYDVDPADVGHHTGSYAEALQEHNKCFDQSIIDEWKNALREVGELKGWVLKNIDGGNEEASVKLVVATISNELEKDSLIVSDDLLGIQSHLEKVRNLLNIKPDDVKIVGVWGLGGIGKTTIAKIVYNEISNHFEGCSFLKNVRDTSLIDLQNQLLSEILEGVRFNITNKDRGIEMIKERLCMRKVLIVLDDVVEKSQLNALVGKRDWFGLGSRIIITTRNEHILVHHEVDGIYEPCEMDPNQSLQLFSRCAFKRDQTPEEYLDLSKDIVKETGGLPLALEVIGSSLFGMEKSEWQVTLEMLQNHFLHAEVLEKLKISFDELTYLEKQIFLDIACFFNGMDKHIACLIWQQRGFYPEEGIKVLCQKSLLKIGENNELKMHDLLGDLGKEIIREENLKVPGRRSRLWSHEEALDVLEKDMGTDKVEGLCIDFGGSSSNQCYLKSEGFTKMSELKLLQVDYAHFVPDSVLSFSELIWLRWKGCPLEFTLMNFHPVNLVVLDLSYSFVTSYWRGWEHIKVAKNLKVLNLTGCQHLLKTPKLANRRLEVLILENCENLAEMDESFNYLEKLVTLNMRDCTKLRDLPYGIGELRSIKNLNLHQCQGLDKIPDSICLLEKLETFDASFCCIKDGGIPDTIGYLPSLKILRLGRNDLQSLPVTVSNLSLLETLDLRFCNELESLPALVGLRNLERLKLDNCRSLAEIEGLQGLDSLVLLTMMNCRSLRKIGKISGLRKLKELRLEGYSMLSEIEGLEGLDSLELLTTKDCGSLWKIGKISNLKKLKELRLKDHSMLSEIEGLEGLDSLELLTMENCKSLRQIGKLSSLRKLKKLKMESCENLLEIEALVGLDSLKHLDVRMCKKLTKIQGLDRLESLKCLDLWGCSSMERLPDLSNLRNLKRLTACWCEKLMEIQGLDRLESLESLDFQGCSSLERLPDFSNLRNLKRLNACSCKTLMEIQGLDRLESLRFLVLRGCSSMKRLPDLSNLKNLKNRSHTFA